MEYVIQQGLNALSYGAEYALLALGLAIVFNIMGLVNFAHGEIIASAAYTMYFMALAGLGSPLLIIPGALLAGMLVAVLFERVAFRPVRNAPTTTGLLTAFGVSILVQNIFLLMVSAKPRAVPELGFLNWNIQIGGISVQSLQGLELTVTLVAILLLVRYLNSSVTGIAMRAAALDFATVRLMGIRANRVIAVAFAISGLLAGIAAVFIVARRGAIDPVMGFGPVLKAFVACVIGGFGSLPGAVLGGFILGFLEVTILVALPQEYGGLKDAVVFSLIAALLLLRPQGLLAGRVELGDKER